MLVVNDLQVSVNGKDVLKGINLDVKAGEVHAIMGPNGSGKSTLGNVLTGRAGYHIKKGSATFDKKDLFALDIDERARCGLFMAMQYPVEIPGVNNAYFLRTALNTIRKYRGEEPLDAMDFMTLLKEKMVIVKMDPSFINRAVNEGFSGGEKKRNEILQMLILEPRLCLLDETDSGLDIDALKTVAKGVNHMRSKDRGIILITHYQRLLDYIEPDHVHVLANGQIVKSGDKTLALELEANGYDWVVNAADKQAEEEA